MKDMEKLLERVRAVEPGNYWPLANEATAIYEHSRDAYDLFILAFRFGFLKGQRAEKAHRATA